LSWAWCFGRGKGRHSTQPTSSVRSGLVASATGFTFSRRLEHRQLIGVFGEEVCGLQEQRGRSAGMRQRQSIFGSDTDRVQKLAGRGM
jgi:hypothetical protein